MGRDGVARSFILDNIWSFLGHGGEVAQRLECALAVCKDLACAFAARPKSGSKLHALHTLRATLFQLPCVQFFGVASSPRRLLKSQSLHSLAGGLSKRAAFGVRPACRRFRNGQRWRKTFARPQEKWRRAAPPHHFTLPVPEGHHDPSPAFQRWVTHETNRVP
jgi:hypothetical protein